MMLQKTYLHVKDPNEAKYKYLIEKPENIKLKYCKDPKALFEYSVICRVSIKILMTTTQEKKCKVLIVFDDMIANQ